MAAGSRLRQDATTTRARVEEETTEKRMERANTFPAASLPPAPPPPPPLPDPNLPGREGDTAISAKREEQSEQAFHGHNRNLLLMRERKARERFHR